MKNDDEEDAQLARVNTHLFGIVDALQVKSGYAGAVQGLPGVLFVAGQDLALQVCTHGIHLITPAGRRRAEERRENEEEIWCKEERER